MRCRVVIFVIWKLNSKRCIFSRAGEDLHCLKGKTRAWQVLVGKGPVTPQEGGP